jgi:hypothetical protein
MASTSISECLKNASHYDPDNRYMAISDLIGEIQKGTPIDDALEQRYVWLLSLGPPGSRAPPCMFAAGSATPC